MKTLKLFLMLIVLFLVAACVYHQVDYSHQDHITCMDYGFKAGTQGYTDCRINLDDRRAKAIEREREREHQREMLGTTVGALSSVLSSESE